MKEYNDEIMVMIDRAQAIEEIAGSVVHEVRNPMAMVSGSLKVMEWKEEMAPYLPQLRGMISEIDRAMGLLSEFIHMTRPKNFELDRGNINDIVLSISELLNAEAVVHRQSIVFDLAPVADICIDGMRFCQVILNLVRNAFEAMEQAKTVTVCTFMEEGQVVFEVTDEGAGFDPSILEDIGSPYKTTKANGSGLGLAACKSIVESHGAEMKVYSSSAGSTVRVVFEVYDAGGLMSDEGEAAPVSQKVVTM
ncbi:MAG: HAMP domain-containing histidine kinase [Peptococcaceae bacterium]|nr:HAMP domain-containing histidine kinase [Peptococcaceae bacterium]